MRRWLVGDECRWLRLFPLATVRVIVCLASDFIRLLLLSRPVDVVRIGDFFEVECNQFVAWRLHAQPFDDSVRNLTVTVVHRDKGEVFSKLLDKQLSTLLKLLYICARGGVDDRFDGLFKAGVTFFRFKQPDACNQQFTIQL